MLSDQLHPLLISMKISILKLMKASQTHLKLRNTYSNLVSQTSFRSIKGKFTPGPDNILPQMLSEAEHILLEPASKLFQLCWKKGEHPDLWNRDNKIFIPKPVSHITIQPNPIVPSA